MRETTHKGLHAGMAWLPLLGLVAIAVAHVHPAVAFDSSIYAREISLARQALVRGDVDEAMRIYERVLEADPNEKRAFWGLVEVYASSGTKGERLVQHIVDWLKSHPDDLRAKLELGSAFAGLGDHERAHEVWTQTLHEGEPEAAKYSEVGTLELRYGMAEHAVETYLDARRVFGAPAFFAEDLVRAYTDIGDYEKALEECVVAVGEHSGIIQWAVNRVELMLDEGADRRKIERDIDELTRSPDSTPSKLSFAGSVYMAVGRPERALGAFLLADERSPDEGRQLLEHALLLRDAGNVKEAREAYRAVEERHSGSMSAATAGVELGLGLAREGRTEEAIAALREAGARYTQHSAGGEALLEVARLELGALGDPEAAMETVSEILEEPRSRGKRLVEESALLRVEALMATNRFEDAHASATELLRGRLHEDIEPRVAYARAFSSFLSHERMRALDEFREMVEGDPSGDLVNDALRVMLVIAEAEEELGSGPVELLADAHSAFLRGDREAGYAALARIADGYAGSAVATEGLLLLAAFSSSDGDYERALGTYSRVLDESGSMTARAEALMRSGDILLRELGRPDDAMNAYSRILEDLPENALSGEARRKIDAVRKGRWLEG